MDNHEWYFKHSFIDMDRTGIIYGVLICKYCNYAVTKNRQAIFSPRECISEDEKIIKDIIE